MQEFISDINRSRDSRLLTMILFIDFRKAFDLVDSNLLIYKLFHYGFDNDSLRLLTDYYSNRQQVVKLDGFSSSVSHLKLGVPQGSVIGPMFFFNFY